MQLKIATWNINSVRLRADLVCRFLERWQPDILCLQETKCPEGLFPSVLFAARGYPHIAERGQAGYHGTAVLSRLPIAEIATRQFCGKDDARHIAVRLTGDGFPWVHSLYVPAGGDLPDPALNPKFAHKIAFLDEMRSWLGNGLHDNAPHILTGDFNVAPLEHDVWSHRQLLKVVSHTPIETERLVAIMAGRNWYDVMRAHVPHTDKLYTWWSYRARDWAASDRGRRLDHIWLDACYRNHRTALEVVRETRGWERSSDHVPVMVTLDLRA
jgi:exodeoxyribonuclease III